MGVQVCEEKSNATCTSVDTILKDTYRAGITGKIGQQNTSSPADVKRDYSKERMMPFYYIGEQTKSGNVDSITNAELQLIIESMN